MSKRVTDKEKRKFGELSGKFCKCGEEKVWVPGNISTRTGERLFQTRCHSCKKNSYKRSYAKHRKTRIEKSRRYYDENRESILSWNRNYRLLNKDRFQEASRNFYLENCESIRQRQNEYYLDNHEASKQRSREYYYKNIEARAEWNLIYRTNNRDKLSEYAREWRANNPDITRAQGALRRARKLNAQCTTCDGSSYVNIPKGQACYICLTDQATATDHVKPLSAGGLHCDGNFAPVCNPCNSAKCGRVWPGHPDWEEFLSRRRGTTVAQAITIKQENTEWHCPRT